MYSCRKVLLIVFSSYELISGPVDRYQCIKGLSLTSLQDAFFQPVKPSQIREATRWIRQCARSLRKGKLVESQKNTFEMQKNGGDRIVTSRFYR